MCSLGLGVPEGLPDVLLCSLGLSVPVGDLDVLTWIWCARRSPRRADLD